MTKVIKTTTANATSKRKGPRKLATASHVDARSVTKTARIFAMMGRVGGATLHELMKETGWQQQSLRGYLSGTNGKRLGHAAGSEKIDGERRYRIEREGELS